MTEEKVGMSKGRKVLIGLIVAFVVLAAGIYGGGMIYFQSHFLPGTRVNGIDCSFRTLEEAQKYIEETVTAYTLAIEERNHGREVLKAADIGLEYAPDDGLENLLGKQNAAGWLFSVSGKKEYQLETSIRYQEEMLKEAVLSLDCLQKENMTEPQDAFIEETDSGYEIVPEVAGSKLDEEKTLNTIRQAVAGKETSVDLEAAGCYISPAVSQDDETLNKQLEQINKLTDVVITYDFDDRTETVDRDIIKEWLVLDEEENYTLDKEKVAAYVYQLGYDYDTFGCTRQFVTSLGETVTIKGGDYGWAIDQDEETEALIAAIESGESQVREPVYAYEGWDRSENDIGDTYVEISVEDQRMWMYKDGELLVDTPVVTGNVSRGWDTPSGVYAVDAMMSPYVLTGEDYESDVTYWIPFNGNIGIHDASWRTEFGGDLYLTEGSHGCVNTPYDQVEIIYQNIGIGAPVVVY